MDSFTEVSHQSWGSRLRGSFQGIIVGFLLVAGGVSLLFWGEGRAVKRAKALEEGASTVVSVDGSGPQSANQGQLVHFWGDAIALEPVRDDLFGVEVDGLKLRREVEMYQWDEDVDSKTTKNSDGSTTTRKTYNYNKTWSSRAIDSSSFHRPGGHENPSFPDYDSSTVVADTVTIGDWILTRRFVDKINRSETLDVDDRILEKARRSVDAEFVRGDGGLYLGSPGSASIGDVRVRFEVVPTTRVSVVGLQSGLELVPYTAKVGGDIVLVGYGDQTADAMFTRAKQGNIALTWGLRVLGFFIVFFGFVAILKPISVLADRVAFVANFVETGVNMIAFVLAIVVSL
ncbi:MAG: TMEM43 family protein, partial [Acidobacteriota bacterium]